MGKQKQSKRYNCSVPTHVPMNSAFTKMFTIFLYLLVLSSFAISAPLDDGPDFRMSQVVETKDNRTQRYKSGWTIIQERDFTKGGNAFQKNGWKEYVQGFGSNSTEYWMGLEKIHHLTSTGEWELLITFTAKDKREALILYDGFKVQGELMYYAISVKNVVEKVGLAHRLSDSRLLLFDGAPFSTHDKVNDMILNGGSYDCTKCWNGAWWFCNCAAFCTNCAAHYIFSNLIEKSEMRSTFMGMRRVDNQRPYGEK